MLHIFTLLATFTMINGLQSITATADAQMDTHGLHCDGDEQDGNFPVVEYLLRVRLGMATSWINGTASLSGWLLMAILVIMVVSSMPFMRRSGYFEVVYIKIDMY